MIEHSGFIARARRLPLEQAFRAVIATPEKAAQMTSMGSVAAFTPGAVLDPHMREQRAFWTRLVREANIQAE